jgi:hypothetical protein
MSSPPRGDRHGPAPAAGPASGTRQPGRREFGARMPAWAVARERAPKHGPIEPLPLSAQTPRSETSRRRAVSARRPRWPATSGVSRSQAATPLDHIPPPHAWHRLANFSTNSGTFASYGSHDVLPIHIGNIWQCGRGDTQCKPRSGSSRARGRSQLKKAPRALRPERSSRSPFVEAGLWRVLCDLIERRTRT